MAEKSSVFRGNNETATGSPVPDAGGDNRLNLQGSGANWSAIENKNFIEDYDAGQDQMIISSADQTVRVLANQRFLVQDEILIESEKGPIHIKVGKSEIIMTAEGKIEILATEIVSDAKGKHTIKGSMVDINPL